MRKLLLASAAMLGATSGIASAQTPVPASANMMMAPSQGMFATPWTQGPAANNNNNAYGQPNTYTGGAAFGKNAVPTPGTVVIRLNGRVQVDMTAEWSTNDKVPGFKTNPINFSSYMRLYPGVDGMATNGLRYGASIELRENFPGSTAQPTPALGSGGVGALGGAAPSPSTYSSGNTVFVRRAFTYLAADNIGLVRFGMTDGLIGLFDPGIYSSATWDAGIGQFNGGTLQAVGATGAFAIPWAVLSQAGAEYSNNKIVYMTPQFFGFDFGVQYAPNMGNSYSTCTAASSGCINTTTGNDPTRWYNQVAVGGRWQGSFGPVNLGVYAVYETAGKEQFFGPAVGSGRGLTGNTYDNLNFFNAATYATVNTGIGSFTWAFDWLGGDVNGQLQMKPTGGVKENAFVTGLVYKNGPLTLGLETMLVESQGAVSLVGVSQRREWEIAFGGNYNIAPGMYLVGEYMYTQRHQGGFDFVTNANGAGATGTPGTGTWRAGRTGDVHGQGFLFSTVVTW